MCYICILPCGKYNRFIYYMEKSDGSVMRNFHVANLRLSQNCSKHISFRSIEAVEYSIQYYEYTHTYHTYILIHIFNGKKSVKVDQLK